MLIGRILLSPFMSVTLVRTIIMPLASALLTSVLYEYVSRKMAQNEMHYQMSERARAHLEYRLSATPPIQRNRRRRRSHDSTISGVNIEEIELNIR